MVGDGTNIFVSLATPKSPVKSTQSVKMTRSAIQRMQGTTPSNNSGSNNQNNPLTSPKASRPATTSRKQPLTSPPPQMPTIQNRSAAPPPPPQTSPPMIRKQKRTINTLTQREQEDAIHRKALSRPNSSPPHNRRTIMNGGGGIVGGNIGGQNHQQQSRFILPSSSNNEQHSTIPSTTTDSDPSSLSSKQCAVTCRAEGTNVEFAFEKYVLVSRILIKTPGQRRGPEAYDIYMVEESRAKLTRIGSGTLEDIAGEQIMSLSDEFQQRIEEKKLKKLLCTFKMAKGQKAFKILDMKVDCRVAE
jgi:hypothetical protein